MAKDSFYFPHDYNARNDVKCLFLRQQLGMEGYGVFWFIVECLAESGGVLPMKIIPVLAMQMQVTEVKVLGVIQNFELFQVDNDRFFSLRLNDHLNLRKLLSEKGKKGVEIREAKREASREASSNPSSKERKERNKRKVNKEPKAANNPLEDLDIKFNSFTDWISKNAPNVSKLKEPFTKDQYEKLLKDYPNGALQLQEVLLAMHNKVDLLKKYTSANLTLRNWMKNHREQTNTTDYAKQRAELEERSRKFAQR